MKISILAPLSLLLGSACAFSPTAFVRNARPSTNLFVDSSKAVEAAMEASKKYGATSEEARAAWDIVEEMDAATSHHKPGDIHVDGTAPKQMTTEVADTKNFVPVEVTDAKTLKEAMADAKKITEEKGITSADARIAWELVEELAATAEHHKTSGQG